jgi:hypothetical protein
MVIFNSWTVLILYTSKVIQNIWANDKKNYFIIQGYEATDLKKERSIPIYIQQDATLHSLFISGNCATCFGWYLHPSAGVHTTVSTASGICHTVTATCHNHGGVGTLPR